MNNLIIIALFLFGFALGIHVENMITEKTILELKADQDELRQMIHEYNLRIIPLEALLRPFEVDSINVLGSGKIIFKGD